MASFNWLTGLLIVTVYWINFSSVNLIFTERTSVRSLVKTKHMVVLTEPILSECNSVPRNIRQKVILYDKREHNIACLRFLLGTYDWSTITRLVHIDDIYSNFLSVVKIV
jgi:hypothetical protein